MFETRDGKPLSADPVAVEWLGAGDLGALPPKLPSGGWGGEGVPGGGPEPYWDTKFSLFGFWALARPGEDVEQNPSLRGYKLFPEGTNAITKGKTYETVNRILQEARNPSGTRPSRWPAQVPYPLPQGWCLRLDVWGEGYDVLRFPDAFFEIHRYACRGAAKDVTIPSGSINMQGYSVYPRRPPTFHRGGPTPSSSSYRGPITLRGAPDETEIGWQEAARRHVGR